MNTWAYYVRRLITFGLDWYISSLLINWSANGLSYLLGGVSAIYIALLLTSILISFLYYVIIPLYVFPKQTLMMHMTHLYIEDERGEVHLGELVLRSFVGCFLLEGAFYIPSTNIRYLIYRLWLLEYAPLYNGVTLLFNIVSVLSLISILFDQKHMLLLHDRLSHTKVVFEESIPSK